MANYEYGTIYFSESYNLGEVVEAGKDDIIIHSLQDKINAKAKDGWELMFVADKIHYFRREIKRRSPLIEVGSSG